MSKPVEKILDWFATAASADRARGGRTARKSDVAGLGTAEPRKQRGSQPANAAGDHQKHGSRPWRTSAAARVEWALTGPGDAARPDSTTHRRVFHDHTSCWIKRSSTGALRRTA